MFGLTLPDFKENTLFGCCSTNVYIRKKGRTVAAHASHVPSNFKMQLCELGLLQSNLFFSFFAPPLAFVLPSASSNSALHAASTGRVELSEEVGGQARKDLQLIHETSNYLIN